MTGAYKQRNKFLKLIKNDFLASSRVISLFYIALALVFAVFGITILLGRFDFLSAEVLEKVTIVHYISIALAGFVSLLMIAVTFFFVVYDFFKSLFGAQGYLSFTLPVTSYELLGSKVIVYGGWFVLSFLTFFFTVGFMSSYTIDRVIGPEKMSIAEGMLDMFRMLVGVNIPSNFHLIFSAIFFVIRIFIMIFNYTFICYFAISLAHIRMFQRFSLLASIPIFFAVMITFVIFEIIICDKIELLIVLTPENDIIGPLFPQEGLKAYKAGYTALNAFPFFVYICFDALMFFLAARIMHKKVNLK